MGLLGALIGAIMLVPTAAGPARADDINKITEAIAGARQRLTDLTSSTEVVTEAFNAGRLRLGAAEQAAVRAADDVGRADAAVRAAQEKRRTVGSVAFQTGDFEQLSVLLSGDPATVLDRAGAMDALARRGRDAEVQLRAARHDLNDAQAGAALALDEQHREVTSLENQKQSIETSIRAQRALLGELVARQADLVRQARENEAAALRAREQAAAQAAAARAAQAVAEQEQLRSLSKLTESAGRGFTDTPISPPPPPPTVGGGGSGSVSGGGGGGGGGAAVAVAEARAQLGKPYMWAAAGPNAFDCSGLTQWVWSKAGVALSHYTGAQWNEGRQVSTAELIPGDLLFFGTDLHHVGIYIGAGKMIDAPHTGTVVRLEDVWWPRLAGAVRPGG
ncbi:C40 family peptidase [Frankia sp. Cr2]|uniref:C40 family peptidase n=1 Tax=Frankia sp. Cr2 TaxID=3073932 RepID=UPI002AD20B8D|nr:C40 family peptidase [Frankia sp. Cr2]